RARNVGSTMKVPEQIHVRRARFRDNQFVAVVDKALSQADGLGPRTRREHDPTFPWLRTSRLECRLPIAVLRRPLRPHVSEPAAATAGRQGSRGPRPPHGPTLAD